jgi:transposase
MTLQEEVERLRVEARKLRQDNATRERSWNQQKERAEKLKGEVDVLKKENQVQAKEINRLNDFIAKLLNLKDKFAGMLFKTNLKKDDSKKTGTKKRGGQPGHIGAGRKKPAHIDQEKEVHLSHCPCCQNELAQSNSFYERIVEDIPLLLNTLATKYSIQRQWCGHCKKEVRGEPKDTLPGFRLGLNTIIWIMFQKYQLRLPLSLIVASLKEQYNLDITTGAIQNILHNLQTKFTPKYKQLIKEIRNNQVKHADETGWRIQGQNAWCWMFSSPKSILYTIEETRGKAVPQRILGENPQGVLVRDDYAGYKKLPMEQQSCWAHLIRVSRELADQEDASQEMQNLHQSLKEMFVELAAIINKGFVQTERDQAYQLYQAKIQKIIQTAYTEKDVKEVQVRITNQNTNLITALKYPNVPLTNNEAERNIRKMVITRKISGGSRSNAGAATHAVNLSVVKTLALKNQSLITSLRKVLTPARQGLVLERTE